jgi:hypothetical protein
MKKYGILTSKQYWGHTGTLDTETNKFTTSYGLVIHIHPSIFYQTVSENGDVNRVLINPYDRE